MDSTWMTWGLGIAIACLCWLYKTFISDRFKDLEAEVARIKKAMLTLDKDMNTLNSSLERVEETSTINHANTREQINTLSESIKIWFEDIRKSQDFLVQYINRALPK